MPKRAANQISRGLSREVTKAEVFDRRAAAFVAYKLSLGDFNAVQPADSQYTAEQFKAMQTRVAHLLESNGTVNYRLGKNACETDVGRMIAVGGLGAQAMPRLVRGLLYRGHVDDLDMVGAQPAMVEGMARSKSGWPYEVVARYNTGRDKLYALVMEANSWSRDKTKQAFTALFFGRSAASAASHGLLDARNPPQLNQTINELLRELATLRELVWNDPECAELKKAVRAAKPEATGKDQKASIEAQKRSLFALWAQTEERRCLQAVEDELVERGFMMQSYIHDGGHIRRVDGKPLPAAVLSACEAAIERDVGYPVRLSIKALESLLKVPAGFTFDDDAEYELEKKWFEASPDGPRVASIASESKFSWHNITTRTVELKSQGELTTVYANRVYGLKRKNFLSRWLLDPQRATYNTIGFWPSHERRDGVLNRFTGFAHERLLADSTIPTASEETVAPIMWLWEQVHGGPEGSKFAHKMQAARMQDACHPPRMFEITAGACGAGKDILHMSLVGPGIWGKAHFFAVENPTRDVFGEFNDQLELAVRVHVQEVSTLPKIDFKMALTKQDMTVNGKGVKKRVADVYATFGGTTNEFASLDLQMEEDDRRMVVYESRRHPKIGNKAFFDDIQRLCEDPSVRKYMTTFWLGLDVQDFDPLKERPRTALFEEGLRASLPAEALFLAHVAESLEWDESRSGRGYKNEADGWCVSMEALYTRFTAWHFNDTGKRPKATKERFLSQIRREAGLVCDGLVGPLTLPGGTDNRFTDEHGTQARGYRIDVPTLGVWLVARGVTKAVAAVEPKKAATPSTEDPF
jgi:hypothetical protein